jgi:hypothetical protein
MRFAIYSRQGGLVNPIPAGQQSFRHLLIAAVIGSVDYFGPALDSQR